MLTVVQAHFEDNAFENCREDGKRPLKWNAVPTLFSIPNKPKRRAADTILVSAPFEKRQCTSTASLGLNMSSMSNVCFLYYCILK